MGILFYSFETDLKAQKSASHELSGRSPRHKIKGQKSKFMYGGTILANKICDTILKEED